MNFTTKVLVSIGAPILIMGLFFYIFSLFEPKIITINPDPNCDLHKTSCKVNLEDRGELILTISPRPVPFKDPFEIEVRLSSFSPDSVQVDFLGLLKETGFKRPALREVSKGIYKTTTDLTHCDEPTMDWQVTVLLADGKDTISIPFRITTEQTKENPKTISNALPLKSKPVGGDFTLESFDGPTSTKNYRGKFLFIYFGYTFCPDICPTALMNLGAAFRQLEPNELENTAGLFVSVDPNRDTLERLKSYTKFFHENIKGVTGKKLEIDRAIKLYGGQYKIHPIKKGKDYYVVDHSGDTYLIDPNGELVESLPHGSTPSEIIEKLRMHLKK